MKKIYLSIITICLFLGHLWFVYYYPDPCCGFVQRKDFEGLTWVIAYLFSLLIYILAKYHGSKLCIPVSCYIIGILCGILLIIWDVAYYVERNILLSFAIYSLMMVIFVILIFHTMRYSPVMALVQLPIALRSLFIYVGDCDKLFQ